MEKEINIPVKVIKKLEKTEEKNFSQAEKIGRLCLFLISFLTPFFFLPITTSPVLFNKHILVAILSLIAFFVYLVKVFQTKEISYHSSSVFYSLIIFFLVVILSFILSPYSFDFHKQVIYQHSFLNFLVYGLIFFLASVFLTKKDISRLFNLILAGIFISSFIGFLQIIGRFILPFSFTKIKSFQPSGYIFSWAVLSALGLIILHSITFENKDDRSFGKLLNLAKKVVWLFLFFLFLSNIIIFNSLFLWLSIAITFIFVAGYYFVFLNQRKKDIYFSIFSVIALFFVLIGQYLFFLPALPGELNLTFPATVSIVKETLSHLRFLFFGSGPGTFEYDFMKFRPLSINQTPFWQIRFSQGFSFFPTFLAETGLLGTISLFLVIFSFFKLSLKNFEEKKEVSLLFPPIFFLMISFLFFPLSFSQGVIFFLLLGMMASLEKEKKISFSLVDKILLEEEKTSSKERAKIFVSFLIFILITFLNLLVFCFLVKGYLANLYYQKGLKRVAENNISQANEFFSKAVVLDGSVGIYKRDLSQVLLRRGLNDLNQKNKQDEGTRKISLAISVARRLADSRSFEPINWENLGNIYQNIIPISQGADVFAKNCYQKAMKIDPKDPRFPADIAQTLILSADKDKLQKNKNWKDKLEEAKKFVEKSLRLKGNYQLALNLSKQISLRLEEKNSKSKAEESKTEESKETKKEKEDFSQGLPNQNIENQTQENKEENNNQ